MVDNFLKKKLYDNIYIIIYYVFNVYSYIGVCVCVLRRRSFLPAGFTVHSTEYSSVGRLNGVFATYPWPATGTKASAKTLQFDTDATGAAANPCLHQGQTGIC